jgi:hypothetical protein
MQGVHDPLATPEGQVVGGAGGEDEFSSKAQIMTLMTTDVDRVSEFSWHLFSLVGASLVLSPCLNGYASWEHLQTLPSRLSSGPFSCTNYSVYYPNFSLSSTLKASLGISCFIGLAVTCLFLPMNHWAGKVVVAAQDSLMKARDERVALMNEVLGAIRMLKVRRPHIFRHGRLRVLCVVYGVGAQLREKDPQD